MNSVVVGEFLPSDSSGDAGAESRAIAAWRKSTFSGPTGECVEVAPAADGGVMVRDSKNPGGAVLAFTTGEWRAFLAGVRNAEFDL
ncbi:DUF397 domain-containing protein [Nonomuraea dietziae]|uniref:DUF397 domain-containing protein n=1 Tax=Nonomuraea dietziae TaxID=65515 RepID=A0A7W5YSK5_9ACTN|nr:DUF397 domain-containing protein [Nonomuraea dietziae]MBB3729159.1 hypothetical protein [Nonomuraea dietziae]